MDIINFDYKTNQLLLVAILNLIMSLIVISRGYKNKVNLYFSLLTFFSFLWTLGLFFGRFLDSSSWIFWSNLSYLAALGIAISLFYFSIHFPYKSKDLKITQHFLILIPAVLLSVLVYIKGWFFVATTKDIVNNIYHLYYYEPTHIIYTLYFLGIVFWAVYHLFIKYKHSEDLLNKQVKLLLITIVIGLIFASYFDLFLMYFDNFNYFYLGPPFTILINFVVFYLIFYNKEK